MSCKIGALPPVKAVFVSANQVNCTVPSLESANRFALEVSNDGSTFTSNGIEIRYFGSPQLSLVDPMPINQEESLEFSVVGVDLVIISLFQKKKNRI